MLIEKGGPRAEFVGQYTSNATLFSTRIQAAVDYMKSLDYVDNSKIVLIGYCLGGTGIVHYLYTRGDESDVAGACGVHPSLFGDWGKPVGTINIPALFLTGGNDFLTGPSASECEKNHVVIDNHNIIPYIAFIQYRQQQLW